MFPTREVLRILSPLPSFRRMQDRMAQYKELDLILRILVIHTFLLGFRMVVRRRCFLTPLALLRTPLQQFRVEGKHTLLHLIFLLIVFLLLLLL